MPLKAREQPKAEAKAFAELEYLFERNRGAVDRLVFKALPERHEVAEIDLLYKMMMDYFFRPRKGLRSSLCTLTCQAFGGRPEDSIITATALELFHGWILIHDDIEDASELRRGQPVLHRKYSMPLAINAGDALHGKMWEVLLMNREALGYEKTLSILSEFATMVNHTTEGQHIELSWVKDGRWDLTEEDYCYMTEKKTAWYTCISPFRLGGIVAEADQKKLEELIPLGRDLGVAFQIKDDILNLVGEERYGKERGGDILEGKRTMMLIRLLNVCGKRDRDRLLGLMGKRRDERGLDDIRTVLGLMEKYHVIDYAQRKAKELSLKAKRAFRRMFDGLPYTEAKGALLDLIDFMTMREW